MRELKKGDRVLIRCRAHRFEVIKVIGDIFYATNDSFVTPGLPKTEQFNQNEIIYHYTPEDLSL